MVHVVSLAFSQNQQFLKDIVTSVLEGQGVGFWKLGRVKTLMEDENYRNFVVSRLNTTLDRKLSDEDMHLEDVVRTFFMSVIQKIMLKPGYETNFTIFLQYF